MRFLTQVRIEEVGNTEGTFGSECVLRIAYCVLCTAYIAAVGLAVYCVLCIVYCAHQRRMAYGVWRMAYGVWRMAYGSQD